MSATAITEEEKIDSALACLSPDCSQKDWFDIGAAVHWWSGGSEYGYQKYRDWSSGSKKFSESDCRNRWKNYKPGSGKQITIGTLFALAKQSGWINPGPATVAPTPPPRPAAKVTLHDDTKERLAALTAIYQKAERAGESAYLSYKKINLPARVRFIRNVSAKLIGFRKPEQDDYGVSGLLVPFFDFDGNLKAAQIIKHDGTKKLNFPGLSTKGVFYPFGDPNGAPVAIFAEGISDAAAIWESLEGENVFVGAVPGVTNLQMVAEEYRSRFADAEIIIAADTLPATDLQIAKNAAEAVGGRVVAPSKHKDFNELYKAEGGAAVKAFFTQRNQFWRSQFITHETADGDKVIKPNIHNLFVLFENEPSWADVLAYDEFNDRIVARTTPPIKTLPGVEQPDMLAPALPVLDDTGRMTRIRAWIDYARIFRGAPTRSDVEDVVFAVASENRVHPVRDYLDGLTWDGTIRLPTFFSDMVGAEQNDYTEALSRAFFVSAVARIYKPGCKVDQMVILEGGQGVYKSSLLQALFGSWHAIVQAKSNDKDFFQNLKGKWCIEFADLHNFSSSEEDALKATLTNQVDHYRPTYAKKAQDVPRQNIFAGTTNRTKYLTDDTGNRRYFPVLCREIKLDEVRELRHQLWAEALHRLRNGETWWEIPLADENRQDRLAGDPWMALIEPWLDGESAGNSRNGVATRRDFVRLEWVTNDCLAVPVDRQSRKTDDRVVAILKRLGWLHGRESITKKQVWGWKRPD